MTRLTPKPEQAEWINQFVNTPHKGGILGLGTGVGKTLVSTEIAHLRNAKRVLIMAPQSTFDSWASTVYWQTGKRLRRCANNAFSFVFTPDPTKRTETEEVKLSAKLCKANLEAAQAGAEGWFFVTRELFTLQDWEVKVQMKDGKPVIDPRTKKPKKTRRRLGIWDKKGAAPYDVVILDENQKFAKQGNYGQQSFGALHGFKVASSADWFGSSVENMYTVARDVFGKEAINFSRAEFVEEYMETEYDHFAYTKKRVKGEQIPGMFAAELPLYVTAPPSVEPPEAEVRYVTLSRQERELYDQLESQYVAMVGDEILDIGIPLTLRARLRELSLGMFYVVRTGEYDEDGIEKMTIDFEPGAKSSKLEEIKDILSDRPGEKFVIYTHSAKWAEKAAADLGWRAWTGARTPAERMDIKRDFIHGNLRGFVATPETMGTGTDGLQAVCNNVIVASPSDQVISNTQGISRIARQGQEKQVNVWDLVARGTFDAGVLRRNGQKVNTNNGAKGW
ncbi:DNA helicase [Microbacterium phage Jacko]|nr:DNA helicase [Microbacterium phage Jacko]